MYKLSIYYSILASAADYFIHKLFILLFFFFIAVIR